MCCHCSLQAQQKRPDGNRPGVIVFKSPFTCRLALIALKRCGRTQTNIESRRLTMHRCSGQQTRHRASLSNNGQAHLAA
jgi:hypothetical protein